MKRAVAFIVAGFSLHAPALEIGAMTLTADEVQACAAEGGCTLITNDKLRYLKARAAATDCRGVDSEWRKGRRQ